MATEPLPAVSLTPKVSLCVCVSHCQEEAQRWKRERVSFGGLAALDSDEERSVAWHAAACSSRGALGEQSMRACGAGAGVSLESVESGFPLCIGTGGLLWRRLLLMVALDEIGGGWDSNTGQGRGMLVGLSEARAYLQPLPFAFMLMTFGKSCEGQLP